VGVEVGLARLHAVENIGELAFDLLKGEDAPEVVRPPKPLLPQQGFDAVILTAQFQQVLGLIGLFVGAELHLNQQASTSFADSAGGEPSLARV
jgi:hypothetical protein